MRWSWMFALAATISSLPPLAAQSGLPTPVIRKADPQIIYVGSAGWVDSLGRVIVYLQGENLAPDDDLGHPTGPDGGYQHIFVRGVSPDGRTVSPWVPATQDHGVRTLGASAKSVIQLGVDPSHYLGQPGSHMQVKLWVSSGATSASDPSSSTAMASDWSPVFTVDVAPAGVAKPVLPPPPPPKAPSLAKLSPATFTLPDPKATFRIKVYGTDIGGTDLRVVFNGDVAGAIPQEERTHYYDDDNSLLPGGLGLFHVTVPERFRKPGPVTVFLLSRDGLRSNSVTLTFQAMAIQPTGRPGIQPQIQPPLKKAVPPPIAPPAVVKP